MGPALREERAVRREGGRGERLEPPHLCCVAFVFHTIQTSSNLVPTLISYIYQFDSIHIHSGGYNCLS